MADTDNRLSIEEICKRAKKASYELATLDTETKNKALLAVADAIESFADDICNYNGDDLKRARESGMSDALLDRLSLAPGSGRIESMAQGVRDIAALPDPIGEVLDTINRPNGLKIVKKRVPIGVIGIIYEARPNVTSDAASICFKSGNAAILKGGSDALYSNITIVKAIRAGLKSVGVTEDAVQLIEDTDHESTNELMKMDKYVNCIIPRGSKRMIQSVVEQSRVPVIETGAGNCHIYVTDSADIDMAVDIIDNAKTQRIGVCNAAESMLVDRAVLPKLMPKLEERLSKHHVIIRADEESSKYLKSYEAATDEDWGCEYLDYIISVKTVDSLDEAIEHINRYSTSHSESIITADEAKAKKFMAEIDSACVYWNASTRFTDGGEFGYGAEIGISTQKLHARGPMGLRELTSYKYLIFGEGQVRP